MHVEVIEVVRPRLVSTPTEGATSTMPDTMTMPAQRSAAAQANGAQMHAVLEERTAATGLGDRLYALPRKAADTLRKALGVFRGDGATASALGRLRAFCGGLLGKIGGIGWGTIAGVILTAGKFRRYALRAAATVYKVVTFPVRLVASGIGWLMRKVGLGRAADWVQAKFAAVESWAAGKVEQAAAWVDANENHGALRWGRAVFQATFIQRALSLVFPWASGAWVFLVSLFFSPTFGTLETRESAHEEAAIKRASQKLAAAGDAVAAVPTAKVTDIAAKAAVADAKLAEVKAAQPAEEMVLDTTTQSLHKVERITMVDGSKYVYIDGIMYDANDVPDRYEFGKVVGTATEAEVAAASNGAGPKLHGPANRAAKRAQNKR